MSVSKTLRNRGVKTMKDVDAGALMRLAILCFCLALTGPACRRQPAVAVIGLAESLPNQIRVANEEISSWRDSAGVEIRFVNGADAPGALGGIGGEVERATFLVKTPGLVGVVGHQDSRSSLIAAPIYNEARIPQLAPTATSRLLKQAGPWTFMLAPDDTLEGAFIGEFVARQLNARSATVFYQLDEYGRGLRDGVVEALGQRGVKVIDQTPFDWLHTEAQSGPPEFDFPSLVAASLRRGIPDVVVIAGRSREAGEIVRLFHARAPATRFVAGDGVQIEPMFLTPIGQAVDLCYLVAFWHPASTDEVSRAYLERYRRVNGNDPTPGLAISHDAIMLLAHAVRVVGPNPAAIRQYLGELGVSRPAYHGVTGMISFAKDRPARLIMTRIQNGVAVPVATN
jgi:ABC-type branched-subunit amino acid transport system substrate-binding protein